MALVRIWNTDPYSLAAIWKIEEPSDFFEQGLPIRFPEISLPRRRLEKLAGRYLLRLLKRDFPLTKIAPDAQDKPRVEGNPYYFSISHSWPYVTVILNSYGESGIDIQCWHPRIDQLQHKFLSPAEQRLLGQDPGKIHLAWSAKEAAYKWAGQRGLRFAEDLLIRTCQFRHPLYDITLYVNGSQEIKNIQLEGLLSEEYSLAYVVNRPSDNRL